MRTPTTLIRDLAVHQVVTVQADASLLDCARAMRERHVGCLVVTDPKTLKATGIVTDRDIVVEAVAVGLDPAAITAGDIALGPAVGVREDEDLLDALARMRENGVRRLVVHGTNGHLAGILSLDDLLGAVAEQFDGIVRVIGSERAREATLRGGTAVPG